MSTEILYLYDQVLEGLIRLRGHIKAEDLRDVSSVVEDMDYLVPFVFRKDFLVLAASLRNFAESTKTKSEIKKYSTPLQGLTSPFSAPYIVSTNEKINLYKTLSRILHSLELNIIRNAREVRYPIAGLSAKEHYIEVTSRPASPFTRGAYVWIQSDTDGLTVLNLHDLYDSVVRYLNEVISIMSGRNIILDKWQRDW